MWVTVLASQPSAAADGDDLLNYLPRLSGPTHRVHCLAKEFHLFGPGQIAFHRRIVYLFLAISVLGWRLKKPGGISVTKSVNVVAPEVGGHKRLSGLCRTIEGQVTEITLKAAGAGVHGDAVACGHVLPRDDVDDTILSFGIETIQWRGDDFNGINGLGRKFVPAHRQAADR